MVGRDPFSMYDDLCRLTGVRHDPWLLDTFIAAVRFMEGEPKKPWWKYTAERNARWRYEQKTGDDRLQPTKQGVDASQGASARKKAVLSWV